MHRCLMEQAKVRVRVRGQLRVRVRRCLSIYPKLQIKIEIVNWRIEIVDRVHYRVRRFSHYFYYCGGSMGRTRVPLRLTEPASHGQRSWCTRCGLQVGLQGGGRCCMFMFRGWGIISCTICQEALPANTSWSMKRDEHLAKLCQQVR